MKNKAGIEIRAGQVWGFEKDVQREVVAIAGNNIIYICRNILLPEPFITGYCNFTNSAWQRLIFCPVLGDMSEWDIVTDGQKRDYNVPKEARYWCQFNEPFDGIEGIWNDWNPVVKWDKSPLWKVPRGFDWDPYRKNQEPVIPKEEVSDEGLQSIQCPKCSQPYYCACGTELRYREPAAPHVYGLPMDHVEKIRQLTSKPTESAAPIDDLDVWSWVDCGNEDSIDKAINQIENKINEIINHLNKEQPNNAKAKEG